MLLKDPPRKLYKLVKFSALPMPHPEKEMGNTSSTVEEKYLGPSGVSGMFQPKPQSTCLAMHHKDHNSGS